MALGRMRSGYGLCGFFLAGNEHVLIGTKVGKTKMESFFGTHRILVWYLYI